MGQQFNFRAARLLEQGTDQRQGIYSVVLLKEGPGNPKDKHFYTSEAIRQGVPVFEGLQCFADHPSSFEEESLPERSVRDMVGWFERVGISEDADGKALMVGKLVTVPGRSYDWVRNLLDAAIVKKQRDPQGKEFIGLSINATGETMPFYVGEEEWNKVTQFVEAKSCDLVTQAGAGGRVVALAESLRGIIKNVREGAMDAIQVKKVADMARTLNDKRLTPLITALDKIHADLTHGEDGPEGDSMPEAKKQAERAKATEKVDDADVKAYTQAGEKLRARLAAVESEAENLRAALGVKTQADVKRGMERRGRAAEDQIPGDHADEPEGFKKDDQDDDASAQGHLDKGDQYAAEREAAVRTQPMVRKGMAEDEDQLGDPGLHADEPEGQKWNQQDDDKTALGYKDKGDQYKAEGEDGAGGAAAGAQPVASYDDWAKTGGPAQDAEDEAEMYAAAQAEDEGEGEGEARAAEQQDGDGDGAADPATILADVQSDLSNLSASTDDDDVQAKIDNVLSELADIQQSLADKEVQDKAGEPEAGENEDEGEAVRQEEAMKKGPGLAEIAKAAERKRAAERKAGAKEAGRRVALSMPEGLREAVARKMFDARIREASDGGKRRLTDLEKSLIAKNAQLEARIATMQEAARMKKLLTTHNVPRAAWPYWSKVLPGLPEREQVEMIEGFRAEVAKEAGLEVEQLPGGTDVSDGKRTAQKGEITAQLAEAGVPVKEA